MVIDLSHCDQEPVRYPGAILPHGALLLLSSNDFAINGASQNVEDWFQKSVTALLDQSLDSLFTESTSKQLRNLISALKPSMTPQLLGCFPIKHTQQTFAIRGHHNGELIILEFEAIDETLSVRSLTAHQTQIHQAVGRIQEARDWQSGLDIAVHELKQFIGCDSVVGVRILEDGSLHAISEEHDAHFPSFLDKYFPSADVPEPARQQMILMPIHYAPDLGYKPVPIITSERWPSAVDIDLGLSRLRSLSPICRRFYQNFGAQSRLLFSLVQNGQLWGFISCRSSHPHPISFPERLAYETFINTATSLILEKQTSERYRQALALKQSIDAISLNLQQTRDLASALQKLPNTLLGALDCTGVVLTTPKHMATAGNVPDQLFIERLCDWLNQQPAFFMTDELPTHFPEASEHLTTICGLLALRLLNGNHYLLIVRPEWVNEVRWAGNPEKPVELDQSTGDYRLTPRASFEEWTQYTHGKSRPWLAHESEVYIHLQTSIILAQQAHQNQLLQQHLQTSNEELESFTYVVSHDLQEPLRGIHNFTQFLANGLAENLPEEQRKWLETIMRLSDRMTNQIQALLQYSRANQQLVHLESVNLHDLVNGILLDMSSRIEQSGGEIVIPRPLPRVICDALRSQAVFENLLTNALKYNDKTQKRIEIGYLDTQPYTFYVKDNGIGIQEKHQPEIFTIFRRLHGRNDFGGGTGAGLTIVRKHIERQGGQIWLKSMPGEGSTFFFTLATAPIQAASLSPSFGENQSA